MLYGMGTRQVLKVPVVGFSTTLLSIAPRTTYTRHELRKPLYLSQLRMVVRPRRANNRSTYQVETLKVTLSAKTLKVSL